LFCPKMSRFFTYDILKDFARKFKTWETKGQDIWAFFNNDMHGYAIEDANRLDKMSKK